MTGAWAVTSASPPWVGALTVLVPFTTAAVVTALTWRTVTRRRRRPPRTAVAAILAAATLTGAGAGWATTAWATTTHAGTVTVTPDGTWHTHPHPGTPGPPGP